MVRLAPALALLSVLTLAACTSQDADPGSSGEGRGNVDTATVPSAGSTSAEPEPVLVPPDPSLELTASTVSSKGCAERPRIHDWAWMDVQWRANQDLESFSFSLVDPVGVELVGDPITVPPVNFGGRIDESGDLDWSNRATFGDSRLIQWGSRDTTTFWTPIEGQTGILVMHLRVTGRGTFSGVQADYTTAAGETGAVTVDTSYDLRHAQDCPEL